MIILERYPWRVSRNRGGIYCIEYHFAGVNVWDSLDNGEIEAEEVPFNYPATKIPREIRVVYCLMRMGETK